MNSLSTAAAPPWSLSGQAWTNAFHRSSVTRMVRFGSPFVGMSAAYRVGTQFGQIEHCGWVPTHVMMTSMNGTKSIAPIDSKRSDKFAEAVQIGRAGNGTYVVQQVYWNATLRKWEGFLRATGLRSEREAREYANQLWLEQGL